MRGEKQPGVIVKICVWIVSLHGEKQPGVIVKICVWIHSAVRSNQESSSRYAFGLGQLLNSVNPVELMVWNSFPENFCLDEMMASLNHLTSLVFADVKLDDRSSFNNLGRLKTLGLMLCSITDSSLEAMLVSYDHLEELWISGCLNLTEKSHEMIGLKTKLHKLTIHDQQISKFQANKLERLCCLTSLTLKVKMVDESILWIGSNLKKLTTLGLNVCAGNTSNCFKNLSSLPLLKELSVAGDLNVLDHEWLSQLNELATVKKYNIS